jgi:hypothetical protein
MYQYWSDAVAVNSVAKNAKLTRIVRLRDIVSSMAIPTLAGLAYANLASLVNRVVAEARSSGTPQEITKAKCEQTRRDSLSFTARFVRKRLVSISRMIYHT